MKRSNNYSTIFASTARKYDLVEGLSILVLEEERKIVTEIVHCLKYPKSWSPVFTYCNADQVESFYRQWQADKRQAHLCYELAKTLGYRKAAAACLQKYREFLKSPLCNLSTWYLLENKTERLAVNNI